MIKKIIILFVLIQNNTFSQIVEIKSIFGEWKYQYSYNKDIRVNLCKLNPFNGESQMSKKYSFPKLESRDTSFYTKFYLLKNWGKAYCSISTFQTVNKSQELNIIFYNDLVRDFKFHWFFVVKIEGSFMHVYDERMYYYSKSKVDNFYHVYRRTK